MTPERPTDLAESTFADELFCASAALSRVEGALCDRLHAIVGVPAAACWWDDVTWDWYDRSVELKNVRNDLELTPEMRQQIAALGFERMWICYQDGTERHYWGTGMAEGGTRRRDGQAVEAP